MSQDKKPFSVRDCLGDKPLTVENLIELSTGSGKCARVAKGMLEALVGKETAEALAREHRPRNA